MRNYPNRVKVVRKYLMLTKEKFAEKYNVDPIVLNAWEKEYAFPPVEIAAQMALDAKVPLAFIYGHEYKLTIDFCDWNQTQKDNYNKESEPGRRDVRDWMLFKYGKGMFVSTPSYSLSIAYGLFGGKIKSFLPELQPIIEDYVEIVKNKYKK